MSKNCPTLTTFNISVLFIVILCFFLLTWILINQTKDYFSQYDTILLRVGNNIKEKLKLNLDKDNNRENYSDLNPSIANILDAINSVTLHQGEDTYTMNKKKTYVCLTDENDKYYSDHTLTYVILHELSHVLCDEIGHTDKFHKIFDNVLEKAALCGLYDKNIEIPNNYAKLDGSCGVSGALKAKHNHEKTLN